MEKPHCINIFKHLVEKDLTRASGIFTPIQNATPGNMGRESSSAELVVSVSPVLSVSSAFELLSFLSASFLKAVTAEMTNQI